MAQPNTQPSTTAIHAGYTPSGDHRPLTVPLYSSAAYEFGSHAEAVEKFALRQAGFTYSRTGNPTVSVFEQRAAALEGGAYAVATATGQAAVALSLLALTQGPKHIIASNQLYGGTVDLLTDSFNDFGIRVSFVDPDEPSAWEAAIEADTRAFFLESVTNPLSTLPDLPELAEVAHRHNIPVVVDNTLATPANFKPLAFGADIVVHSATKALAGHGQVLGGVVVDAGTFDFSDQERWPQIARARERYAGTSLLARYGDGAYSMLVRSKFLHDLGPALSAGNAHTILTGMETLPVRATAATRNLLLLANFLQAHPLLKAVHHPSRSAHRHHDRLAKFFPRGTGSVLAVELHDADLVPAFIDNLEIITLAANIGDTRTMIAHPATMTHCRLSTQQLEQAGLNAAVLRLSVGLEDPADLIRDLDRALAAAQAAASIEKEVSFA
ncbi:aminotransferase class I/II-fold pyridoxal phosphate-dependent enzyme [Glutamicibacter sp. MNS18]|uniref:O-acetylhomoserine aminocarboxypropyltransferase/cysteine synthase family protein n=1 Tax=Glutamicibacter sp. MNS18 TaxID=2989817 RepID=UPI0022369622|nr:aminotransferase class I/II-fold pyridoxal phosphate-dependent enzyme [Glutamicibacter sp. MNS18]MCW4465017.1 aminotransferase class I/II-fold pyridoxal phosphate-dependent enzyme [Glutamicibacter sp. MNS18]